MTASGMDRNINLDKCLYECFLRFAKRGLVPLKRRLCRYLFLGIIITMKKSKNIKLLKSTYLPVILTLLIGLLIGYGLGIVLKPQSQKLDLATATEKANAKEMISLHYRDANTIKCSDSTDPLLPNDRVAVFDNYLRVNGYANRAVIRGCNNLDRLLVKTRQGDWVLTEVNLNLDTRVNPKWQRECMIQDITTTDTVTRPENSTIDSSNFQECQKINRL